MSIAVQPWISLWVMTIKEQIMEIRKLSTNISFLFLMNLTQSSNLHHCQGDVCTQSYEINHLMTEWLTGMWGKLYHVLWWHLWMTCDNRQRGSSVRRGQRKWAHRKCSHTGPPSACTASRAAPPEDLGLRAPTKPHAGLHHCSESETQKNRLRST